MADHRHSGPSAALRTFLASEATGGIVLMGAAALGLIAANSPAAPRYFAALAAHVGPLSLHHRVNDALMALFFLLVGLEIKREFIEGSLARWSDRRLPILAAAAGMAVPAAVYLAIAGHAPGLTHGWAIPAVTDIAFAIGVLALLGSRAPVSLLCGIGFTMSLFIGGLAFVDPLLLPEVKLGVLGGSFASGLVGYLVLRFASRPEPLARHNA